MVDIIHGTEIESGVDNRSQVYKATHNEDGTRRPHMYRSFISFSYGGKWIEDFSLIAVTDGDRLSHSLHADFTDITHDPEVYDGQHYWDTHLKANAWDLTLSTDGITDAELEEFRRWFAPGAIRELILAEHPNRGIMARISTTPTYSMIPFEGESEINIAGRMHTAKTTLYKGDITISFVMDDPYWYAINSIIPNNKIIDGMGYEDDADGVFLREDALKVAYEDKVAFQSQVTSDYIFLGQESPSQAKTLYSSQTVAYMYYCGTAPCKPTIAMKITPIIPKYKQNNPDRNNVFITFPANSYSGEQKYNIIEFKSVNSYQLKFTTPGLYTGYNQAVDIIQRLVPDTTSWEDARTLLRDGIKHFAPRAFAMAALNSRQGIAGDRATINGDDITAMKDVMPNFLLDQSSGDNKTLLSAQFIINCKTGRVRGAFDYNTISYTINEGEITYTYSRIDRAHEEDTGDMIKSEYLSLEDRNCPSQDGLITVWSSEEPTNSYKITANCLINPFLINYQNLYY